MTVSISLPSELRGAVAAEMMLRVGDSGPMVVGMFDLSRDMVYLWLMRSAKMKPYSPKVDAA